VAEGAALEMLYTGNCIEGSNPSSSASFQQSDLSRDVRRNFSLTDAPSYARRNKSGEKFKPGLDLSTFLPMLGSGDESDGRRPPHGGGRKVRTPQGGELANGQARSSVEGRDDKCNREQTAYPDALASVWVAMVKR
jgi:hypothetical protein